MAMKEISCGTEPIEKVLMPFQRFFRTSAASGIILLIFAVTAMVWANSPWYESYHHLLHTELTFGLGNASLTHDLHWWINDGLMAIFFFVVGLEIKRELLVGELSSIKQAILPIVAATGGMVVPAVLYVAVTMGSEGVSGWGVPMATDIAFALGVLALLGDRVPLSLKVFLAAVAIADDIGAVMVIALFYTSHISVLLLVLAGVFLLVALAGNILGVRRPLFYALVGLAVWFCFLKSGIHSTVAGVAMAMIIPARTRCDTDLFLFNSSNIIDEFKRHHHPGSNVLTNPGQLAAIQSMQNVSNKAQTPLQHLEHALVPWVDFIIMPLFALANAGVHLPANIGHALLEPVTLGVMIGLFFGKQLGILGAVKLMTATRLASLPKGVTKRHVYGASLLAGIGFTMSLFIATLAFDDPVLLTDAKIGILAASFVSGVGGWLVLRGTPSISEQGG